MPKGMATMPQRIPFAMAGRSSSSRIPIATGMVNTTVAPSMEPVITPLGTVRGYQVGFQGQTVEGGKGEFL